MAGFPSKSYARNLLEKYGWTEGKGLGKAESGMVEALKPKLKFDNTGIGHDHADQFNFNWWEIAFNDAAKRVSVNVANGKSKIHVEADAHQLSTKRPSIAKLLKDNPLKYGRFIKTETLTSGGNLIPVLGKVTPPDDDERTTSNLSNLTDDELLKICGGRTAHKAARHGHKLVGKLARVIEQEKCHLSKWENNKGEADLELDPEVGSEEDGGERRKKRKKKRRKLLMQAEEYKLSIEATCAASDESATEPVALKTGSDDDRLGDHECGVIKKKKKKRQSTCDNEVGGCRSELLAGSEQERETDCPGKTPMSACVLEYEGGRDCEKRLAKRKKRSQ